MRGIPSNSLLYEKSFDDDVLMLAPFAPQIYIRIIEVPPANQQWNFIRLPDPE